MRGELFDSPEALERSIPGWDALAVAAARPYCAPAWMLAWWRHVAPRPAALRVAVAVDAQGVAGVAPLFVERRSGLARYRLLASGTCSRIEPLARPGLEREAAGAMAKALAAATPSPSVVALDGAPALSPWPSLLAEAWPTRTPSTRRDFATPAPTLNLREHASFEEWLAAKSSNFRQQMRRSLRKLEAAGATFRLTRTREELDRDLQAFAQLHYARWSERGGSMALDARVELMLADAGRGLLSGERFRLWSIDVDGATIASHVFLAAGGELTYWLGGFDDAWATERPSLHVLAAALADAFERGEERFDLGPGGQDYKYRFADGEDTLETVTLVPRSLRSEALLVPERLRRELTRRLPEPARARLRRVLRRRTGG